MKYIIFYMGAIITLINLCIGILYTLAENELYGYIKIKTILQISLSTAMGITIYAFALSQY